MFYVIEHNEMGYLDLYKISYRDAKLQFTRQLAYAIKFYDEESAQDIMNYYDLGNMAKIKMLAEPKTPIEKQRFFLGGHVRGLEPNGQ